MTQPRFSKQNSLVAALMGWLPFTMLDLSWERVSLANGRQEFLGETFYNVQDVFDAIEDNARSGWKVVDWTVFPVE